MLEVGTEVSAKYRGAFCEATIKHVKKLIKIRVSYGPRPDPHAYWDFNKDVLLLLFYHRA